ncbi:hypothetical protein QYF61_017538 [Mycteria americana]|uniref:Uncharacterized protein n=1 Tax=Mycteria americana TaxID=33587 RepID=A0AAN7S910_MYCAM|nr:hypothetical protein QYF61_017538 [Mycteria americana]
MPEQFVKNCSPWEGPMLEKFMKDCNPWEGPVLEQGKSVRCHNELANANLLKFESKSAFFFASLPVWSSSKSLNCK